jgi:hypothetical protein
MSKALIDAHVLYLSGVSIGMFAITLRLIARTSERGQ